MGERLRTKYKEVLNPKHTSNKMLADNPNFLSEFRASSSYISGKRRTGLLTSNWKDRQFKAGKGIYTSGKNKKPGFMHPGYPAVGAVSEFSRNMNTALKSHKLRDKYIELVQNMTLAWMDKRGLNLTDMKGHEKKIQQMDYNMTTISKNLLNGGMFGIKEGQQTRGEVALESLIAHGYKNRGKKDASEVSPPFHYQESHQPLSSSRGVINIPAKGELKTPLQKMFGVGLGKSSYRRRGRHNRGTYIRNPISFSARWDKEGYIELIEGTWHIFQSVAATLLIAVTEKVRQETVKHIKEKQRRFKGKYMPNTKRDGDIYDKLADSLGYYISTNTIGGGKAGRGTLNLQAGQYKNKEMAASAILSMFTLDKGTEPTGWMPKSQKSGTPVGIFAEAGTKGFWSKTSPLRGTKRYKNTGFAGKISRGDTKKYDIGSHRRRNVFKLKSRKPEDWEYVGKRYSPDEAYHTE